MSGRYIVTGTDTGVGKTIVAAGLARHLGARYWKPVQSGLDDETDSETVGRLTAGRIEVLPEAYRLTKPRSPHESARIDGVEIDPEHMPLPGGDGPLVVEGAGGVLVPLGPGLLAIDMFVRWGLPVVVVARTALGTINHSLLTLAALRARAIEVAGVIFCGDERAPSEEAIVQHGGCRHLGRLPWLDPLDADVLAAAFARYVRVDLLA